MVSFYSILYPKVIILTLVPHLRPLESVLFSLLSNALNDNMYMTFNIILLCNNCNKKDVCYFLLNCKNGPLVHFVYVWGVHAHAHEVLDFLAISYKAIRYGSRIFPQSIFML